MKVENEMALPITKSVTVMLLEPYAGKLARTVLRGESSRKGADLLDYLWGRTVRHGLAVAVERWRYSLGLVCVAGQCHRSGVVPAIVGMHAWIS